MHDEPTGFCGCGCGKRTAISAYTNRSRGWVKGQPRKYVKGHNSYGAHGADYVAEDRGHDTPCWVWLKSRTPKGYGFMLRGERRHVAHVFYWERANGMPVPDGLELDHLCRVRECVNPDHLEPVTHKENMRRAMVAWHVPGVSTARDLRIGLRISQEELGDALGYSQPVVSAWECGRQPTPAAVLEWLHAEGRG
jgi:hypothetical protein